MPGVGGTRPSKQEYACLLALAARTRADCLGRRVGAVVVRDDRVLSTGYNGTPIGMPNCSEGGCHRCAQRDTTAYPVGGGYDLCVCVHAEQNAILAAARFGQSTLGATLTSTLRPCFGCCKEALQAGVTQVRYLDEWQPAAGERDQGLQLQYASLRARFERFEPVTVDLAHLVAFLGPAAPEPDPTAGSG
ncbi:MAG TPA: dCMP deaminase family protein [Verrucomicrobiae bacterium]|nr:dCMP deaminase family protein [Verrucomicrobiae bacterium]